MKIATTTGDFKFYCKTDEECIRELYRAGFRYIDLNMYGFTADCVYMQEGWRDEVQKLKDLADSLGMKFVQAHSQGGNGLSEDKKATEFIIKATLRSLEICQMLGIKNTVLHPGFAAGITKEEWFIRNKEFYSRLLPTAERCNVNILCENQMEFNLPQELYYYTNTGKEMREFIKFVNHPNFHACWDTGHGNSKENQYEEIMALGDELYAIHYNDNRGTADEHVAPFLGVLNHDELMHALIDVGFKGYFTLECESSLRKYNQWTGKRRRYDTDLRLSQPQLFMQRHMEKMLYETAEWILSSYGVLEK